MLNMDNNSKKLFAVRGMTTAATAVNTNKSGEGEFC